jgi:hypothetical protein
MDAQTTRVEFAGAANTGSSGFRLQVVIEPFEGPIRGRTLHVQNELSVGRDPAADLRLDGRLISRKHAIVRVAGEGLEIEDVSSNGTLVDGTLLHMGRRRVGRECILIVGCVRLWLCAAAFADSERCARHT